MSYLFAEKLTWELFIPQFVSKKYIYFSLLRTYCFSFAGCLYLNSLSKTCIFALLKTFFYITLPAISILIHCRSNVFICPACNVLLYSFGGGFVFYSLSKKCVYFPCLKRIAIYLSGLFIPYSLSTKYIYLPC